MNISQKYIQSQLLKVPQGLRFNRKEWDESKHPRVPAGNGDESGEFTQKEEVDLSKMPSNIKEGREISEKILKEGGFDYQWIASSDSNGISIYFDVEGRKVRFSDHEISNSGRMENETTFYFGDKPYIIKQNYLKLKYDLGYKNIEYGKYFEYIRKDGSVLLSYGYRETTITDK